MDNCRDEDFSDGVANLTVLAAVLFKVVADNGITAVVAVVGWLAGVRGKTETGQARVAG